jgi:hypothetical protein
MPKRNIDKFRLDRASELRRLAEILEGERMCDGIHPLLNASDQCRQGSGETWGYELERLIFRLSNIKNAIPKRVSNVTLELSIKVTGICILEDEVCDPFSALEFNMTLGGEHRDAGLIKKVMCSWHLDRDLGAGAGVQEYMHPIYHFQHGGRHTWNTGLSYGAALILEAPRFAHPPMDAILGVDFVLTNFFVSSSLNFRDEFEYRSIIRTAHARIWRPYVHALALAWTPAASSSTWPPTDKLWPQLLS